MRPQLMLFKSTISLSLFAPIEKNVKFEGLSPIIRQVEEDHLIPLIGEDVFNALNTAFTDAAQETSLTDPQKALLQRCRDVIAPLVCYNFTPQTEVKLNDAGAQRMETGTNKTAYQNQVNNFRDQMLADADKAVERLYKFLEANKETYPDWQQSDEYADYRSLFIKTGAEFNANFSSASPYRNYYAMRAQMFDVEQSTIKKLLGADLFDSLKETDADPEGVFTAQEKNLLISIKKAVAYLTVANAIPFLNVKIDGNGLTIMNAAGGQDDQLTKRSAAGDSALNNYIEACRRSANIWINNISEWIAENITNPVANTAPADTGNINRKGTFGLF